MPCVEMKFCTAFIIKTSTMQTPYFLKTAMQPKAIKILKLCLLLNNLATLTTYIVIRVLFHEYHLSMSEEMLMFLKTIVMGTVPGLSFYLLYVLIDIVDAFLKNQYLFKFSLRPGVATCVIAAIVLVAHSFSFPANSLLRKYVLAKDFAV